VEVRGGGSSVAIAALIEGKVDICASSRTMSAAEQEKLKRRHSSAPVEIPVARQALAIYVHPRNPLASLTVAQVKAIFTGTVENWKEVGGPDLRLVLYSQPHDSPAHVFLRNEALGGEPISAAARFRKGNTITSSVATDRGGIGYADVGDAGGAIAVAIKLTEGSPPVAPSAPAVQNRSYPLSRTLFLYVRGGAGLEVRSFLDYVRSPEGQGALSRAGFLPGK
jgi:phosphate transport system substrate-binding protein